mmetsp:Transcript_12920/g.20223  ORF Transcript_12920/g.20223 Transcript_12920/m.20223 type:complete len:239 (-) Transcript_12920:56-772(-)
MPLDPPVLKRDQSPDMQKAKRKSPADHQLLTPSPPEPIFPAPDQHAPGPQGRIFDSPGCGPPTAFHHECRVGPQPNPPRSHACVRGMLARWIGPAAHGVRPHIILPLLIFHLELKLGEELMPSPSAAHWAADGPEVLAEPMDQSPMVCAGPDSHPRLNPATEFVERSHKGIRLLLPYLPSPLALYPLPLQLAAEKSYRPQKAFFVVLTQYCANRKIGGINVQKKRLCGIRNVEHGLLN